MLILSILTWLAIAVITIGGFVVMAVLALVTFPFDRRRYVVGRTFRLVGVLSARVSPFWRFGVHGAIPKRIDGRTVVVSNHESNADPFLISFLPWEMKWLGKASLFKIPIVGWNMWLAGDVPIHRGEATSARGALERCRRWLDRGVPVMFFPEGTRSKTEELLPFKDGAFRLAIEAQAPVLPIAVSGTRTALPKHSAKFGFSRAAVTVGTPIPTAGMTLADLEALKARARAEIERMRGELQAVLREREAHA